MKHLPFLIPISSSFATIANGQADAGRQVYADITQTEGKKNIVFNTTPTIQSVNGVFNQVFPLRDNDIVFVKLVKLNNP